MSPLNLENPSLEPLARWLPIDLTFRRSAISVRWLEFGSMSLNEPFFNMTVEKLRSPPVLARELDTDLRTLLMRAGPLPPVQPKGLIFHVSRCGSTLLSNALRTARDTVVLSEARPVGALLQPHLLRNSPFAPDEWDPARKMLLDSLLTIYGYHDSMASNLVIKCGTDMLHMGVARAVWPDVPFLVLIRNPVEVIISVLDRAAGWLDLRRDPEKAAAVFGWHGVEVEDMSAEEYCARVIGRYCEAALPMIDARTRVLDYQNMTSARIRQTAEFFDLDLPPQESGEFQRVIETYSKDPEQSRPYESDRERKRGAVTEYIRTLAGKWAMPHYEALRNLEAW